MKTMLLMFISASLIFSLACNFTVRTQDGDEIYSSGGPSDTPEPTEQATVTFATTTPVVIPTQESTDGISATATPTATQTATYTPTATATSVPPTSTPTASPTSTFTPTATATAEHECRPVTIDGVTKYPEDVPGFRCLNGRWTLETGE